MTQPSGINKVQMLFDKGVEYFYLARDGKNELENGSPERRKRIVITLGSNPLLTRKIFSICIKKALLPFETISKELRDIHGRVEPAKTPINTMELYKLYAKNLVLRCILKIARTEFLA